MGIFGVKATTQAEMSTGELALAISGEDAGIRMEAEATAKAGDSTLRRRFASVWPTSFEIPADGPMRLAAVESAMVSQERNELADLSSRAVAIGRMEERDLLAVFGSPPLPRDEGRRFEAAIDLALLDVPGHENPSLAAERALEQARKLREVLKIGREEADRFKDVSPLARVVWKHVPELASRFGVAVGKDEGYSQGDAERANVGLPMHNAGTDARAASKMRWGFSEAANKHLDVLVGEDGSGGMLTRLVDQSVLRERRFGRQSDAIRQGEASKSARDLSAAAFLSRTFSR